IKKAWVEQRAIKDVMVFLQSHGVMTSHAVKIYKRYGDRAVTLVRDSPYRLATDIFGIGFQTADAIAMNVGIERTSAEPCQAGVLHVLSALSDEGHVAAPRAELVERAKELLGVDESLVLAALPPLVVRGEVVIETEHGTGEAVYLTPLHVAETGIAELLGRLARAARRPIQIDIERAIPWVQDRHGL